MQCILKWNKRLANLFSTKETFQPYHTTKTMWLTNYLTRYHIVVATIIKEYEYNVKLFACVSIYSIFFVSWSPQFFSFLNLLQIYTTRCISYFETTFISKSITHRYIRYYVSKTGGTPSVQGNLFNLNSREFIVESLLYLLDQSWELIEPFSPL